MLYIMLWVDEEQKWYYMKENFKHSRFPYGYVDYYVKVLDGFIISDSYLYSNAKKRFDECYDKGLWAA